MKKCIKCGTIMTDYGHALLCENCGYTMYITADDREKLKLNDEKIVAEPKMPTHPKLVAPNHALERDRRVGGGKIMNALSGIFICVGAFVFLFFLATVTVDSKSKRNNYPSEPFSAEIMEQMREVPLTPMVDGINLEEAQEKMRIMMESAVGEIFKNEEGEQLVLVLDSVYNNVRSYHFFQGDDGKFYIEFSNNNGSGDIIESKYENVSLDNLRIMPYLEEISIVLPDDEEITAEQVDIFENLKKLELNNYSSEDLSFFEQFENVETIIINGLVVKAEEETTDEQY